MRTGLTQFICGWRGFVVGHRRSWHAHHRPGLAGFRAGFILADLTYQVGMLARVFRLADEVFARGGSLWCYGVGSTRCYPWGRTHAVWRPGSLSNCFVLRAWRLAVGSTKVLRRRPVRSCHRPGRSGVLASVQQVGGLPVAVVDSLAAAEGYLTATRRSIFVPPVRRRPRWVQLVRLFSFWARTTVFPVALPRRRRIAWTVDAPLPQVVFLGGLTLLGASMVHEAPALGVPLVLFHSSDAFPTGSTVSLTWNPDPASLVGWPKLLGVVHRRAILAGAYRVVWQRLAER